MIPYRSMAIVFLLAACAYVAVSFAVFQMPLTLEEAEACGFTSADFTPSGELVHARAQAWWLAFVRTADYWSAFSIALAAAFARFALGVARRMGAGAAAHGFALGSGLLAFGAVCVSCLAPALAAVGLGMTAGLMAGIPKWLMAVNTLLLCAWGTLFLSRRAAACALLRPAHPNHRGSMT